MEQEDKKDKLIASLSMKVIQLSMLVFILIILFLTFYFRKEEKPDLPAFADAVVYPPAMYSEDPGSKIFKRQCAACHLLSADRITGPGFYGLMWRVPSERWLRAYIMNSDSLAKAKDPYTLKLRSENGNAVMPSFGKLLTAKQLDDLVVFLKDNSIKVEEPVAIN